MIFNFFKSYQNERMSITIETMKTASNGAILLASKIKFRASSTVSVLLKEVRIIVTSFLISKRFISYEHFESVE